MTIDNLIFNLNNIAFYAAGSALVIDTHPQENSQNIDKPPQKRPFPGVINFLNPVLQLRVISVIMKLIEHDP